MKTIYKFLLDITDNQLLEIKGLIKILHVGLDPQGRLCLWAMVDTDDPTKTLTVIGIRGTGHPCDDVRDIDMQYLGTVSMGDFIWHIFKGRDTTKEKNQ